MKKIFAVIPITVIFILLSHAYTVFAATYTLNPDNYDNVVYITGYEAGWYNGQQLVTIVAGSNYVLTFNSGSTQDNLRSQYNVFNLKNVNIGDFTVQSNVGTQATSFTMSNIQSIVVYKGSFNFGNYTTPEQSFDNWQDYQDYINPPEPEPTWFEIWSNRVAQFFEDWMPWAVDLDHWLDDIYLDLFGMQLDGDDVQYGNDIEFYDFPSPTPFPTPIPYQQQIVPDNNGGYTIQYIYPDPSGNPITASAPPPQPTYIIKITDSPQYDISGVPVPPADGLQDAIDAIDDNIEDYQEGFDAIQGSFSVLPVKWFFFFGIPAAIILIAGIIRSLLGG